MTRPDSFRSDGYGIEPSRYEGHPLVGSTWASKHYPVRVVMAVNVSRDGRLRARLTNNIPGMTTWRLLTDDGRISGHHQIADPSPMVEKLAAQFEGSGVDPAAVATALRWPAYDWPGARARRPSRKYDEVPFDAAALTSVAMGIMVAREVGEQATIAQFDSPNAGYAHAAFPEPSGAMEP